ncbi:hypothetical protein BCJMU51_2542 [Bacillus cereus]|nr:hypothetical protein A3782_02075 [Bacillus sp. GZT]BCB37653.1 hypothetical protein BCM0045_2548 [Bacillus cereus]BCC00477.1 hypothetical protein BCM0057_2559 [Bacillus cereus]BCC23985.1 hypothetical protein BCM0079_2578 [Bacillus cereus]BCC35579.1 hypothetical protein BCM0105_2569 [Bacillus cereus]
MSISVSDELQLFAQEIQSFLSQNTLRNLARDVGFVQRTSLCIRDLGYFHLKDLQYIQDKEAYYISRIKSNTRIY